MWDSKNLQVSILCAINVCAAQVIEWLILAIETFHWPNNQVININIIAK